MGTGRFGRRTPLRGAIVVMTEDESPSGRHIIGVDGGLPWHYSADLKRFKKRTMGSVIIMGRVTWCSIGRKALPGRRNIVISRSKVADAEHYAGVEQALAAYPERRIWIIGGGQIYRAAMPYLNLLDVTFVPDLHHRRRCRPLPRNRSRLAGAPALSARCPAMIACATHCIAASGRTSRQMGKRVFDTYHAPEAETDGVKAALDAAGIAYYETHKGKWGVGSAGIWVSDSGDYGRARVVIEGFQREWVERVRREEVPARVNWRRLPALLVVVGVIFYLTFYWYF